jgi:hypothetical protein
LNNKKYYSIALLFSGGLLSRFPFLEKMQSHWDGAQYSMAVIRYSLQEHTPSPPGYPLYIAFGKVFHFFVNDPHLSILLVSVLFSGIGAVVFYLLGLRLFNKSVGIIASLLFLSGPTFYFFGITANPYGIMPITAALLTLVVYELMKKKKSREIFLGLSFAFAIGMRPQDALFLTPLFLYGLYVVPRKNRIKIIISCLLGIVAWLIPLIVVTGGISEFVRVLNEYKQGALPGFSFSYLLHVWFIMAKGLFLSFGISIIFLLTYFQEIITFLKRSNKLSLLKTNKYIHLFSLLILPSLFFNMFVRSDHAAHQMTYLSGILILVSYALWKTLKKNKAILWVAICIIIAFNLFTFFRDRDPGLKKPYVTQSYHYSEIRKNNIKLHGKVDFILTHFDSQKTLIITTPNLWRQYSYYFKNYELVDLSGIETNQVEFVHTRRDAKNWNMREYFNKDLTVVIPDNITTVVFPDDESKNWIKNHAFRVYELPGNSSITSISISPNTSLNYSYQSVKVAK